MKKMKPCVDCQHPRRCRPAVKLASGEILYVCYDCWHTLKYDDYIPPGGLNSGDTLALFAP